MYENEYVKKCSNCLCSRCEDQDNCPRNGCEGGGCSEDLEIWCFDCEYFRDRI